MNAHQRRFSRRHPRRVVRTGTESDWSAPQRATLRCAGEGCGDKIKDGVVWVRGEPYHDGCVPRDGGVR